MFKEFVLAVALFCPNEHETITTEIITTKPITWPQCELALEDKEKRKRIPKDKTKQGCEYDLLCIRVVWTE